MENNFRNVEENKQTTLGLMIWDGGGEVNTVEQFRNFTYEMKKNCVCSVVKY